MPRTMKNTLMSESQRKRSISSAHYRCYWWLKRLRTGIAFFGTPHAGGNEALVAIGLIASKIAELTFMKPKNDIAKTLKSGSMFIDLLSDNWRHQLEDYQLVSFYEADGAVSFRSLPGISIFQLRLYFRLLIGIVLPSS